MNGGCIEMKDLFGGNSDVQAALLRFICNAHVWSHCMSCFNKGYKCKFLYPFKSCEANHIHSHTGDNDKNYIALHRLKGPVFIVTL